MSNSKKIRVAAIVAMDEARVIGCDNQLPWNIPEDLKHFSKLTKGQTVLMGRKTFDSLPEQFKPLPKRMNVVVSRDVEKLAEVSNIEVSDNPIAFIEEVKAGERQIQGDTLWVIGGEQIYRLTQQLWDGLELTLVKGRHQGDAFFPEFEDSFALLDSQVLENFSFLTYARKD